MIITGCDLETSSITIPAKLDGYPVVAIADYAFRNCEYTSVGIPNSVLSIGRCAFFGASELKSIKLPAKLKTLSGGVFSDCTSLANVTLNGKLESIGVYASSECVSLKKIVLPNSVTTIRERAFEKCYKLNSIRLSNKLKKIDSYAFYRNYDLKSVVLPKKLRVIPESTFEDCTSIKKLSLPSSVVLIKKKAFSDSGLVNIRMNSNMQFIGNGAFRGTKVQNVKLGSKVTFIGNQVFADCKKLKSISVPASVKGINPGAFNSCNSLQAINVSSSNAYYSSSEGVLYNKDKSKLIQYPVHKMSSSFTTAGNVARIRPNAFAENPYLKNITVNAVTIGEGAFANMKNLRSVKMNRTVTIESDAFLNTNLTSVRIPSGLSKLGSGVFSDCDNISAFTGGGGNYKTEDGVLYNRTKQKLLKYPSRKTTTSFTVPNSVKEVNAYAFDKVSHLTNLYFGSEFRKLHYAAVSSAKNLKSIVFNSKKIGYGSSSGVSDCPKLAVIVGPNSYVMRRMAKNANATLITL